jgi:hypothetical protein
LKVMAPSHLTRAFGAILLGLLFATIGSAAVVGLLTFTLFFLLLVPVFLMLLVAAIVLGRGRLRVYVYRRSARRNGDGRSPQ